MRLFTLNRQRCKELCDEFFVYFYSLKLVVLSGLAETLLYGVFFLV